MPGVLRTLLVVLFFSLALVWVVSSSQSFRGCVADRTSPFPHALSEKPENKATSAYADCLGRFVHDYRDEISAAFTAILAFSTIFLWLATRDLARGVVATGRRQLRAYLGFESMDLQKVAVGEKPVLTIKVQNFGQTPAYHVRYWLEARVMDPKIDKFSRIKWTPGEHTIDPGGNFNISSTFDDSLTPDQFEGVSNNTTPIFFYGRLTYRDAFGHKRIKDFRLEHGGPKLLGTPKMALSHKGNKAN